MLTNLVCVWGVWRTFKAIASAERAEGVIDGDDSATAADRPGSRDGVGAGADAATIAMAKWWSCFGAFVLYDAYVDWVYATPGSSVEDVSSRRPTKEPRSIKRVKISRFSPHDCT